MTSWGGSRVHMLVTVWGGSSNRHFPYGNPSARWFNVPRALILCYFYLVQFSV